MCLYVYIINKGRFGKLPFDVCSKMEWRFLFLKVTVSVYGNKRNLIIFYERIGANHKTSISLKDKTVGIIKRIGPRLVPIT